MGSNPASHVGRPSRSLKGIDHSAKIWNSALSMLGTQGTYLIKYVVYCHADLIQAATGWRQNDEFAGSIARSTQRGARRLSSGTMPPLNDSMRTKLLLLPLRTAVTLLHNLPSILSMIASIRSPSPGH
jgi:hypothetical protein